MNKEPLELSVVIPIYYSAKIFPELYERLRAALEPVTSSFEIIAVVDGCTDESADVVASFHERDERVKLIEFSRNFGNQMAISAGLRQSRGEMVVVIDDDLEDPPEMIPGLMEKAREGYDVVYAVRRKRELPANEFAPVLRVRSNRLDPDRFRKDPQPRRGLPRPDPCKQIVRNPGAAFRKVVRTPAHSSERMGD